MKSWIPLLVAALLGPSLSSCFVGVDRNRYDDEALFTVEWTVDGANDSEVCFDFDAEYAYVTVESRYGVEAEDTVLCDRFGIDFYVLPGDYWATVQLLDRAERPITTVVETDTYPLYEGDREYVVADFPPSSFR
jgi:hypothetical protein